MSKKEEPMCIALKTKPCEPVFVEYEDYYQCKHCGKKVEYCGNESEDSVTQISDLIEPGKDDPSGEQKYKTQEYEKKRKINGHNEVERYCTLISSNCPYGFIEKCKNKYDEFSSKYSKELKFKRVSIITRGVVYHYAQADGYVLNMDDFIKKISDDALSNATDKKNIKRDINIFEREFCKKENKPSLPVVSVNDRIIQIMKRQSEENSFQKYNVALQNMCNKVYKLYEGKRPNSIAACICIFLVDRLELTEEEKNNIRRNIITNCNTSLNKVNELMKELSQYESNFINEINKLK